MILAHVGHDHAAHHWGPALILASIAFAVAIAVYWMHVWTRARRRL